MAEFNAVQLLTRFCLVWIRKEANTLEIHNTQGPEHTETYSLEIQKEAHRMYNAVFN